MGCIVHATGIDAAIEADMENAGADAKAELQEEYNELKEWGNSIDERMDRVGDDMERGWENFEGDLKRGWNDFTNVGFRNDSDNGNPQPRVTFDLGGAFNVATVDVFSVTAFSALDESISISSSTDGVNFSAPVVVNPDIDSKKESTGESPEKA